MLSALCVVCCAAQDVKKAQSLGFAFDKGIEVVEGDVTKGARSVVGLSGHLGLSLKVAHGLKLLQCAQLAAAEGTCPAVLTTCHSSRGWCCQHP
jgi:hypothetical protein